MSRTVKAMKPRPSTSELTNSANNPKFGLGRLPFRHRQSRVWGHGICATFPKSCCGCRPDLRARRRTFGNSAFAESSLGSANRITAVYRVDLAGFNLGDFRLTTQFRGTDYEMRGEGRFSVLSGLVFDWRGTTASKGRFNGTGPEPAMYSLNFQGGDKSQQLRMTFDGGAVTQTRACRRSGQIRTSSPSPRSSSKACSIR